MYDLLIESGRIENRKRPIINNEIEAAIKIKQKLPTNENAGPNGFIGEFWHTCREKLIPILPKTLQKMSEERVLLNSFYDVNVTLILKPDKDTTQKRQL